MLPFPSPSCSRVDHLVLLLVLPCTLCIVLVSLSICASTRDAFQSYAPIQVSQIEVALVLFCACDEHVSSDAPGIGFQW